MSIGDLGTCVVRGCTRQSRTVGMCQMHYIRSKKHSALDAPPRAAHGAKSGGRATPEYTAWQRIRDRCNNRNSKDFPYYGGRGIRVCARWEASFEAFLADVGHRPTPAHTIDRIDNYRGYEPGNVRWATRAEQSRNRRPFSMIGKSTRARWITVGDVQDSIAGWSRRSGLTRGCIRSRLRYGWEPSRAVTEPLGTTPSGPKRKS